MAKNKVEYWSRSSQHYDRSVDGALGDKNRALVDGRLRNEGDLGSVVEFGCGTGYFTTTLAQKSESVIATDFSDDMLSVAAKHLEGCDVVQFKNENWQHTAFADDTFDTVFSGFVLPCVDGKLNAIQESYRILKPGGSLIIANPNVMLLSRLSTIRFLLEEHHSMARQSSAR
ncbi:MAG: class I SAM-dependent methyltransferase [Halobacteriota archaeon]